MKKQVDDFKLHADRKKKFSFIPSIILCLGIVFFQAADYFKTYSFENLGDGKITVTVEGAVKRPGTYELSAGDSKRDAVKASEGLTDTAHIDEADLQQPVINNEYVYVPNISEHSSIININTADISALVTLPGIGEKTAKKIISYREQNNGFSDILEIKKIPGIGNKKYLKIKDLIKVD